MLRITFPRDFTWGAATSSYQIEGSPLADGASPSIWHEFSHQNGRIIDGGNGDLACDHYRRWPEDIRQMRELGLAAYRFSVAWPRIVSEPGKVNAAGLDFYKRLVDGLLESGIEPWITLFHWETPAWLERLGGFTTRESVGHFAFHVETVLRALGDRVGHWITENEPSNYAALGYAIGVFPPGRSRDLPGMYHAAHHLLLAHGRALEAIRAVSPHAQAGIALGTVWIAPRNPRSRLDRAAARFMDGVYTRFYLDAVLRGTYPADVLREAARFLPRGFEKDLPGIAQTPDFLGLNYYNQETFRWAPLQPYIRARKVQDARAPRSPLWEIFPPGLYLHMARLRDQYTNPPVVITENGFPTIETAGRDPLDDPERVGYLRDHVALVGRAIEDGCKCLGYFHWTLMDNFEWQHGFTVRFGLLRTDFGSQKRQWRTSARWYRDLLSARALEVDSLALDGAGPARRQSAPQAGATALRDD